jgi:hypothetical protein
LKKQPEKVDSYSRGSRPLPEPPYTTQNEPSMKSLHRSLLLMLALVLVSMSALSQLVFRDTDFSAAQDTGGTRDVDLLTIPGKVILLTGTNTDLALNKDIAVRYSNPDPLKISSHPTAFNPYTMIDGKVSATSFFELLPGQEGTVIRIDLQAVRVVNRVVTRVFPANSANFRVRGYSIYLGLDTLTFKKVKQIADNANANTNDFFDPDTARYVAIRIDKQDPSLTNAFSTTFGEIEIYGVGYLQQGTLQSKVKDATIPVNWNRASWKAATPQGTSVRIQVRTGDTPTVGPSWSSWSNEVTTQNSLFNVLEPRRYMQYRANLYTSSVETPRLDEVTISYDTLLVAKSTVAQILPQTSQILKEAEFDYQVRIEADSRSTGVDTLVLFTSIPMVISNVSVNSLNVPFTLRSVAGQIVIGFENTINFTSTVSVHLKFTPFLDQTVFPSQVISKRNPDNPQQVDAVTTANGASWTLVALGVPEQVIVSAKADPNPFTPNGDGRNDYTYISFFVSNLILERPVSISIFDVTGRMVRSLLDTKSTAQAFVEQNAIQWDGRDNNGRLLPPGLYIYQIKVDVDGLSPAVVTKTVSIAY